MSLFAIILIIGIVMALKQSQLHLVALPVLVALVWHNLLGMLAEYYTSKWLGLDDKTCRTIAIEVGMQNSGLQLYWRKTIFQLWRPCLRLYSVSGITSAVRCLPATGNVKRML